MLLYPYCVVSGSSMGLGLDGLICSFTGSLIERDMDTPKERVARVYLLFNGDGACRVGVH